MIHRAYTIFDSKIEAYLKPFFAVTDGDARRSFGDAVNDTASAFYRHPGDFTLFFIGVYDDTRGTMKSDNHENLGVAIEYKLDAPIQLNAQEG